MEICTYQELRSTVAESRIEREKEKKKKKKKPTHHNRALQLLQKKKCSFPVNFGREKKKTHKPIRTTTEGEAHQQDEINLWLIGFPIETRRCGCGGAASSRAHQPGARTPMFEVNKYNRLSRLEISSCFAISPSHLSTNRTKDRRTQKIKRRKKKKNPPPPLKQQQLQGGCWFHSRGWSGGQNATVPPRQVPRKIK